MCQITGPMIVSEIRIAKPVLDDNELVLARLLQSWTILTRIFAVLKCKLWCYFINKSIINNEYSTKCVNYCQMGLRRNLTILVIATASSSGLVVKPEFPFIMWFVAGVTKEKLWRQGSEIQK